MNTDSFNAPVWQFRVNEDGVAPKTVRYHCFVEDASLCGSCYQNTAFYDDGISAESSAILELPHLTCQRCLKKWRRKYQVEG